MQYSPFLSCRQASRLITAQLDRPLGLFERIGLDLHLRICSACPIVISQMRHIREAMRDWRGVADGDVVPYQRPES